MDFFQYMLVICFVIGVSFILYSIKNFHGINEESSEEDTSMLIGHKLKEFDTSISEADQAIHDLNDMSQEVFKKFDEKYQELLFLYTLIDEKKEELSGLGEREITYHPQKKNSQRKNPLDIVVGDDVKPTFKIQTLNQILALQNEGKTIAEIAKILNMGKGEVSLILELGKGRRV